ncbi:MAG: hypothetical protein WC686_02085 [Candidatus Shapirobacteria bacterium]|jgi:hypothetical protein
MKLPKVSIVYLLLTLLFGISIGVVGNDLPYVIFKRDISIPDVINFFIYIFGILYINNKISNNRVEKDILIEMCNRLSDEVSESKKLIDEFVTTTSVKAIKKLASQIISKMTDIRNAIATLESSCKDSKKIDDNISSLISAIKDDNFNYFKTSTQNLAGKKPKITPEDYNMAKEHAYQQTIKASRLKLMINNQ